jgi:CMP-N,N'-diacetyllegionaminic acid synthase
MKIICTICARGNSTGLKNKNILKVNGKPLIYHTIKKAKNSGIFDKIVVSSDSKKILKIVKKFGVDLCIIRPKKFATKNISKIPALRHAVKKSENEFKSNFDFIVDLDICSPLRQVSDIKNSLNIFKKNKNSNLITITDADRNPYFNMIEKKSGKYQIVCKTKKKIYSRQKAPKVFSMNSSIYIWTKKTLFKHKTLFLKKTGVYYMPKSRSIDIDDKFSLNYVKYLMKNDK